MFIYFLLSVAAIISGIMVISATHPVHSIIWLVSCFVAVGALFIALNMNFVGMVLLVVYVGAIAVLFIFIIMMLNLTSFGSDYGVAHILPAVVVIAVCIVTQIFMLNNTATSLLGNDFLEPISLSSIQIMGQKFYTLFDAYLIISSLVLLVAMVGTIVLTLSLNQTSKKQNIFTQISRDKHNFL